VGHEYRRPVTAVAVLAVLALSAGAQGAVAQPAFGGSGLTITALSPDTTTPFSGTQDFIYVQLSGNAPSGGVTISTSSSNQSVMPIPASVTVAAGSDQGQVEFTAGNVTTATTAKFTATLGRREQRPRHADRAVERHQLGRGSQSHPTPSLNNTLFGVAVVSANDIWAVGETGNATTGSPSTLIEQTLTEFNS
jgi:hypothetical protein